MTPADLDEIEQRANAATPGPWIADVAPDPETGQFLIYDVNDSCVCDAYERDRSFIAAARSDVPALVAEVRRKDGVIAEMLASSVMNAADCARLRAMAEECSFRTAVAEAEMRRLRASLEAATCDGCGAPMLGEHPLACPNRRTPSATK